MKTTRTSDSAITLIRQSQSFAAMAFSEHSFSVLNTHGFLDLCYFAFGLLFAVWIPCKVHGETKTFCYGGSIKNEAFFRKWKRKWDSVCLFYFTFFLLFFLLLSYFLCRGRGEESAASRDFTSIESLHLSFKMMISVLGRFDCQRRRSCTLAEMGDEITTLPLSFLFSLQSTTQHTHAS
jgi:hypothetical protein